MDPSLFAVTPPAASPALSLQDMSRTVEWIANLQLSNGMIPWFTGGHADPWNHVEATMALCVAGRVKEVDKAFDWLIATQLETGAWYNYYSTTGVEDIRVDTNVCAYVATGVWYRYLQDGDIGFLETVWPMLSKAIDFVLSCQRSDGEILWSIEPDGSPGGFALLAGSSSIYLSLRSALACAHALGMEKPEWTLAAGRLAHALNSHPELFKPKHSYAMDWYYPVLTGVLDAEAGWKRINSRLHEFVMDGRGVRCVSDKPWITAAETAECAIALASLPMEDAARLAEMLFHMAQGMRRDDGSYWTGMVYPEEITFPFQEVTSYTAAAMVLAFDALWGNGPTLSLFRGYGLPSGLDLFDAVDAYCERCEVGFEPGDEVLIPSGH